MNSPQPNSLPVAFDRQYSPAQPQTPQCPTPPDPVHITFGRSRAETISVALQSLGRHERVIGIPDDLSLGPIDPPDHDLRHSWMTSVLRHDLDDFRYDDPRDAEQTWTEATAPNIHPTFWVCLSDAAEHACYLEFLSRMTGRPLAIIDATNLPYTTSDGIEKPWSLGVMRPADIVASFLPSKSRELTQAEATAARARWSQLRQENAPFRIVRDGHLVSAPLTHFDRFLTDQATNEWEVAARLLGRTITHMSHHLDPPGQSPSDIVLFGRLRALAETGALELSGPGPGMRDYKVRKK